MILTKLKYVDLVQFFMAIFSRIGLQFFLPKQAAPAALIFSEQQKQ